jgi:peptidoglycan/xylan/chitin deacetylase (PgdA/CDA1 family)
LLRRERRLPVGTGGVALTFDDGPDPCYTPAVLDVLATFGVVATFFCVGDLAASQPDIVRRMIEEGHAVGSHGAMHADLPTLANAELAGNLRGGRDMVAAVVGAPVPLFRPPHGDATLRTGLMARGLGLHTWLWTVDPEDWRPGIRSAEVVSGCSQAGEGDVIVLHDGLQEPWSPEALDRSATVEALPEIIEGGRSKGLQFVRLPA